VDPPAEQPVAADVVEVDQLASRLVALRRERAERWPLVECAVGSMLLVVGNVCEDPTTCDGEIERWAAVERRRIVGGISTADLEARAGSGPEQPPKDAVVPLLAGVPV
jgi:hypothetical protein